MSARTMVPCRADAERAAAALAEVGVSRVVLFGSVARGGRTSGRGVGVMISTSLRRSDRYPSPCGAFSDVGVDVG